MEYDHLQTSIGYNTRSPSAYEALRGFGILQLPGVSTLKTFTSFNVDNSGFNEEQLSYAREQYDRMVAEKKAAGELVPFSEGILVFVEVKVGLKVHYYAKTGKFVRLAQRIQEITHSREDPITYEAHT